MMQVNSKLVLDVPQELSTPRVSTQTSGDRGFSSLLNGQTSPAQPEAKAASSSPIPATSRQESEKNTSKTDSKKKSDEAAAVQDANRERNIEQLDARSEEQVTEAESDGGESDEVEIDEAADSDVIELELEPDAATAESELGSTGGSSLPHLDFLAHLQISLEASEQMASGKPLPLPGWDAVNDEVTAEDVETDTSVLASDADRTAVAAQSAAAISARTEALPAEKTSQTNPAQLLAQEGNESDGSGESFAFAGMNGAEAEDSSDEVVSSGSAENLPAEQASDASGESGNPLTQLAALLSSGVTREGASHTGQRRPNAEATALDQEALAAATSKAEVSADSADQASADQSALDLQRGATTTAQSEASSRNQAGSAEMSLFPRTLNAQNTASSENVSARSATVQQQLAAVHLASPQQAVPELAERMTLMIGQKWHEAEIQLEPQGLGKMSIQLSIDQDQKATIQFVVQQGASRDLLEQAMPRLRDMLASQGVQLGETSVQQQTSGQQQSQGQLAQQERQGGGNSWQGGLNSQGESVDVQNLAIHSTDAAGIDFYA